MSLIALIPLFPLIGFLINGLGYKKIPKAIVAPVGIGAALLSFITTVLVYFQFKADGQTIIQPLFDWITVGGLNISFAFQIDQLSIIMLFIITGVGTLIHLYSKGYMSHDEGYGKFFAYLNLFLFSMLLLVMGANYLIMFIGWEGVGLCSYLLIGFWNKRSDFGDAARKAFIMNRVGDLGFLIGIFLIIRQFGTLEYLSVFEQAQGLEMGNISIMFITFCLFIGAMGKSAQIPLFTWLPDAMAGPTPVSALIHAATMVTSGIYMVVRSNVLYTLSPDTLEFIAWIGTLTALLAASIALFQNDIKKVLAYSTVSQLGYMFIGLGVMAYTSGFFHVITHAFFKALLFLGAGSVIHAMSDEQDISKMGGLWSKIKITAATFLIGTIAISGLPPFAGFFSKDEILAHVFEHNKAMWALAMVGSFMTAFYMFRLFFLTFTGKFRGTKEQEDHLHESPSSMTIPLIVLAGLSIVGGFIGFPEIFHLPHALADFLSPLYDGSRAVNPEFGLVHLSHSTEWMLMGFSVLLAAVALGVAWFIYVKKETQPADPSQLGGIKKVLADKYYLDEAYQIAFVKPVEKASQFFYSTIDKKAIDRVVEGTGDLTSLLNRLSTKLQTGSTGFYILVMSIAVAAILILNMGTEIADQFFSIFNAQTK
ncbi:NADH-quinone oxidoreductase subunit L [Jiulongibacter sediminis]|uniref:NADH:ubiquinone oxidoreductase subunit L n=1 Tax=Jiulongibacter sediminis TaxID=1605367 RepID=A0A0P7BR50_9BACT|nr:NADH-quinone oxidoreductase subunit L [Jiulongibacter sediminis]KPM46691.1 NADH:ubiquinone oxidoreductase subunit L [Jiulongibacter sediminis]